MLRGRGLSRVANAHLSSQIWGPGDGRPVPELKVEMDALLAEFLVSGDVAEAERCVRLLNCAYYHHELVKRGVILVADRSAEDQARVSQLLQQLHDNEVLSEAQVAQGLLKVYTNLVDITLDAPCAPSCHEFFVAFSLEHGLVQPSFTLE